MMILSAIFLLGLMSFFIRIAPLATPARIRNTNFIRILATQLPITLMILLILHSYNFSKPISPQIVGIAVTALVHLWQRQTLLSIACGVASYIITLKVFG